MIEVLYRDRDLLLAVKPVGVLSEKTSTPTGGDRVVTDLLQEQLHLPYIGLVHRLDRVSGGVMLFSLRREMTGKLCAMMQEHCKEKVYLAVCEHAPEPPEGRMTDLLFFDRLAGKSYVVDRLRKGAKEARLSYRTLASGAPYSLAAVSLETGRPHQIRAQFSSRGYPLCGDRKYGSREKECGCALWAWRLSFAHPVTGKPVSVQSAPPDVYPWNLFGTAGIRENTERREKEGIADGIS